MKCFKKKKKISDLLDGRLSDKKKLDLDNHISQCTACQDYKNQLMAIHSKVREREKSKISMDYEQEFSIKLKRRLLDEQQKRQNLKTRFPGFEKWAYSAAGFIVVIFLALYFVILQPVSIQTEEYFVLSYEDAIGNIYGEINNDAELEELFNTIIMASLTEALEDLEVETIPFIIENPLYGEELSEEELRNLESKIKLKREEDIKS